VVEAEEEKLTNALVKLPRSGKRIVYVLKGHGEREVGNTERAGFSQAKDQMEKANYEVKELLLAREAKVADDAALVIVPGPRTDLFPQELQSLDAYIAQGGKVFFMATPFQSEGLVKYLEKYGVVLDDDVVIELNPVGQLFGVGPLVPLINQYESHPITKDLGGVMTLFPLTRSLDASKTPPKGISVSALARTSAQSWGETDKSVFQRGEAKQDLLRRRTAAGGRRRDHRAPSGEAGEQARVGSDKKPPVAHRGRRHRRFRLQPVPRGAGQSRLLPQRGLLARAGGSDLDSPQGHAVNPIILTSAQSSLVLWLPLAVLPGAVLLCGILVVMNRRRLS
jgi:hypothetical protein